MIFNLNRDIRHDNKVTLGTLESADGDFKVFTLERPWMENRPYVSCIPTGKYHAFRSWYNAGDYEVFELADVPGRTEILFHVGNYLKNTEGCILVGMGYDRDVPAVWSSRTAFKQLMDYTAGLDGFEISVF